MNAARRIQRLAILAALAVAGLHPACAAHAAQLRAGAAKVDITNVDAGPANDPLYAKALVVTDGTTTVAIVTVDAVAIGEIGPIGNEYLPNVRAALQRDLGIDPTHVMINASHCHGIVCADADKRTVQCVKDAAKNLVPVRIAAGRGHEDRVSENRRLKLKSGRVADVRHAYSLPPDEEVAEVGPIDPEIGLLRLDREDGSTLAVVYNFACHPIQGVPSGANTADLIAFSSRVLEESFKGSVALFLQGCGGDINPVRYKDVDSPRDAEPLGNLLGLSAMRAAKTLEPRDDDRLHIINETMELPRADFAERMDLLQHEQMRLVQSLQGTTLNLKTFMPLAVKHGLSESFPSYYSHRYLQDQKLGRHDLEKLDADNHRAMQAYMQNIYVMEELTRLQTNLALLKKHQAQNVAAAKRTLDVVLVGLRIGDFVLTTFPGELTVQIGLNLKKASPHDFTFVAGYTNGYIYYAPTTEQLLNLGAAQEDCDTLLAPEWQPQYEAKAAELLRKL